MFDDVFSIDQQKQLKYALYRRAWTDAYYANKLPAAIDEYVWLQFMCEQHDPQYPK